MSKTTFYRTRALQKPAALKMQNNLSPAVALLR